MDFALALAVTARAKGAFREPFPGATVGVSIGLVRLVLSVAQLYL
jgi:hypothetical protein